MLWCCFVLLVVVCSKTNAIDPFFMLLDKQRKIVMDWSPKSACTKMVEMFWNQMGLYRGQYYPKDAFIHDHRLRFYKEYGRVTELMLSDPQYYKFKVVRNPWDRAVSIYNHLMSNRQDKYFYSNEFLVTYLKKHKFELPSSEKGLSFEEFFRMYNILAREGIQYSYVRDRKDQTLLHQRQQMNKEEYEALQNGTHFFDRIVKLENFEQDIAFVNNDKKTNYTFPVGIDPHIAKRHIEPDQYVGNMSWQLLRNHIPFDYSRYYNKFSKKLVEHLYIQDIIGYNYTYPYSRTY